MPGCVVLYLVREAKVKVSFSALLKLSALLVVALCFLGPVVGSRLGVDPFSLAAERSYLAPSWPHLLGCDELGRDFLMRLLYGGRISLAVAIFGSLGGFTLGGAIGLLAGFFGGFIDSLLMRFTEFFLSLPKLPLMLVLLVIEPTGMPSWMGSDSTLFVFRLSIVLALLNWMDMARVARSLAKQLRSEAYLTQAEALGASSIHLIRLHLGPASLGPLFALLGLELSGHILYEGLLSFLGLGVPPSVPSWGALLAQGLKYWTEAPAMVILPGLCTFVVVAGINLSADQLHQRLDHRLQ